MRAEIDRNGVLTVKAETETEAFALREWDVQYVKAYDAMDESAVMLKIRSSQMIIDFGIDDD